MSKPTQQQLDDLLDVAAMVRVMDSRVLYMGAWCTHCGTVACVIGHACESLPHLELKLVPSEYGALVPSYCELTGWNAVEARFGLSGREAQYLFGGGEYGYPVYGPEVSARIERFVSERRPSLTVELKPEACRVREEALCP